MKFEVNDIIIHRLTKKHAEITNIKDDIVYITEHNGFNVAMNMWSLKNNYKLANVQNVKSVIKQINRILAHPKLDKM